ncbi:MAG: adenylyltransferase/cytidyltransferase family protein [Nitrososphaera sp.]
MDALDKALLSAVYCATLEPSVSARDRLRARLPISDEIYESGINRLMDRGLLEKTAENIVRLSFLGRDAIRVVLVGGVFDVIHPGHIHTLKAAKSEGDVLVVIVARTSTAQKIKKGRRIFHDEALRKELVSSLGFVDLVLVGREGTLYDSVEYVRPDVIALGYDQAHSEKDVAENCKKRSIQVQVLRLSTPMPGTKSSAIKEELGESIYGI